jgi:hypothetical protein
MLLFSCKVFSQSRVFQEGEELNYIVYYGFIKLGEVNIFLISKTSEGDKIILKSMSTMKSYSGIPFVKLNSTFETEMVFDGKNVYSRKFKATENNEDGVIIIEYDFNYDSDYVHVKKINKGNIERDEKMKFNKNVKFQDGLSLFYQARLNSFTTETFIVPVFMNESETSVNYYIASVPERISTELSDNDIASIRCTGTANFTGVFGLSGEFAGWFSNDYARVPLRSKLNVIIGNVTLELDSFKRSSWKPN